MGKFKGNKTNPIVSITEADKSNIDFSNLEMVVLDSDPRRIAYVIPSHWIKNLISMPRLFTNAIPEDLDVDLSVYVDANLATGTPGELIKEDALIGIQFDFKSNSPFDEELKELAVWQIYFFEQESKYYRFRQLKTATKDSINYSPVTLSRDIIHPINTILESNSTTEVSHFQLQVAPSSNEPDSYHKLDYFNPDTGFVFFSKNQLRIICEEYNQFVLSGCKIDFGKKLTFNDANKLNIGGGYFSLKLEGQDPMAASNSQNNTIQEAEYTDTVIGHPCPPTWQSLRAMEGAALDSIKNEKIDSTFLKKMRASWLGLHSKTKSVIYSNSSYRPRI